MMKDIPKVGFICTGESALELSGAICCAGRLMRLFTDNGYMTGGCYSCISPSKQIPALRERIINMCMCNDVVVTVGCDGFRREDVLPDIVSSLCQRDLAYFASKLSSEEYVDAERKQLCRCFPSRATAAMYGTSVVINVSSDLPEALGKLTSLMFAIDFAVGNSAGKKPSKQGDFENMLSQVYSEAVFHD